MMWRDVVDLVKIIQTPDGRGGYVETEEKRTVFANVMAVKRAEFYAAEASIAAGHGIQPKVAVNIRSVDYEGETVVDHNGERFYLVRRYSANGEVDELVCSSKRVERG